MKPKLPKLIPRRFDGDPKMWLEFWDSFEGSIHNNEGLSDRDKLDHLKGITGWTCKIGCHWVYIDISKL